MEQRYNGYRLFLERLFLPEDIRVDVVGVLSMLSELLIEDGIIILGELLDFKDKPKPLKEPPIPKLEPQKKVSK